VMDESARRPDGRDPDTWAGVVWRIVDRATESNTTLFRVSILLMLVGLVVIGAALCHAGLPGASPPGRSEARHV
jgi:hypothetical protein